jgi:hypothetical protein
MKKMTMMMMVVAKSLVMDMGSYNLLDKIS